MSATRFRRDAGRDEAVLPGDHGFLYFIGAGPHPEETRFPAVKVGITGDPEPLKRLRQLQANSPAALSIWAAVPATSPDDLRDAEKRLHLILADLRQHGEWFSLEDAVLRVVRLARAAWGEPDANGVPPRCSAQRLERDLRVEAAAKWDAIVCDWLVKYKSVLQPFDLLLEEYELPVAFSRLPPPAVRWHSACEFVAEFEATDLHAANG